MNSSLTAATRLEIDESIIHSQLKIRVSEMFSVYDFMLHADAVQYINKNYKIQNNTTYFYFRVIMMNLMTF